MIVERQADAQLGSSFAVRLAADLRSEFPYISGFSRRNIFYMLEFYMLYRDDKRVQPLVAQLGWSHNLAILQRCKDSLERELYIRMTRKFGWSKNVLIHHIDNQSYEVRGACGRNMARAASRKPDRGHRYAWIRPGTTARVRRRSCSRFAPTMHPTS